MIETNQIEQSTPSLDLSSCSDIIENANLTDEQYYSLGRCLAHSMGETEDQTMILGASGGRGKTYLVNVFLACLARFGKQSVSLAFTGRAASRIKAQTCHSFLYTPELDGEGNLIRFAEKSIDELKESAGDIIVIDEGSMNPRNIHNRLSQIGVKMLYSGDYGQLPPINEEKGDTFNAMVSLPGERLELTKNLRFGENSGIGILADRLRHENVMPRMKKDDVRMVSRRDPFSPKFYEGKNIDVILCGMNKTRRKLNDTYRRYIGTYGEDLPQVGERIMCLRNNIVANTRINNGELFEVKMVYPGADVSRFAIENIETGEFTTVPVANETWDSEQIPRGYAKDVPGISQFTFGYACTVHKFQGSQAKTVFFYDEDVSFFLDQKKFRYTAVSRAEEMLYVAI